MLNIKEYLDKKFKSYIENSWLINDWIFYGADFGLILKMEKDNWSLWTYEESGYAPSKLIIDNLNIKQVSNIVQNISPTKNGYKTERK